MKVYLDAFGGDKAPLENIKGAILATQKYPSVTVVLFGDENIIRTHLMEQKYTGNKIEIIDAKEIISNNESPVDAIKTKKNSSIVKAYDMMREDDECVGFVSAGSTGAVLTGAFLKVGRIKNIKRPALAPLFPTFNGKQVLIIDCGANMDCDEHNLVQFAQMGDAFMKSMYNMENPRIALLSVGDEDKKGNDLTKKAFALLKELNINFVGNMEARYALSGDYDVIVTDGFAGNVLIKSIEGTASSLMKLLKSSLTKNLKSKIGALLLKSSLMEMKQILDYHKYGGAPLLGTKKIVIKSHGSSNAESICISIKQVIDFHEKELLKNIQNSIGD